MRVEGSRSRIRNLGFWVQGPGFRVQVLGFDPAVGSGALVADLGMRLECLLEAFASGKKQKIFFPESQGQNLAVTVLYVPKLLGSGLVNLLAQSPCIRAHQFGEPGQFPLQS